MSTTQEIILASPSAEEWKKVGVGHHHGINVPLFALHSEKSCGIGEYLDLLPLIDLCQATGFSVIQLLPLNDTGHERSPYCALSAIALNPLHLSLESLPYVQETPELKALLPHLKELNKTPKVDYPKVFEAREKFLELYFNKNFDRIKDTDAYRQFVEQNGWVIDYGLYKALKIDNGWKSWKDWPPEQRDPSSQTLDRLKWEKQQQINYHVFWQFFCFQQLEQVKRYAEEHQVYLKGDIPILLSEDSVDVWLYRYLFNLDLHAGAPPDMFSELGQNWGVPIYNWQKHQEQNNWWWKSRLKAAGGLYHIYRIDHIVGFFRIWSIPGNKTGKEGFFLPQEKQEWLTLGERNLRVLLENSPMLPIGEDLGVIPDEVRACLSRLGICGTKVMRWERDWHGDQHYLDPKQYQPLSMSTVSTHDSETLREWWENSPQDAQAWCKMKNWTYQPKLPKEYQKSILQDSHHSGSLFHINLLAEYLDLFPNMSSEDPADERINIPGLVLDSNWTYRFRPSVEEIVSSQAVRNLFQEIKS